MCAVLILVSGLGWQVSHAQTGGQLYFPEKGHWVSGDFLTAYQSVENPLLLYGYPITEAFQDQTTQRIVQYFQRARFELHPEAPPELRVQLTPIGQYLYKPGQGLAIPDNFPACRLFAETGFQVCYTFLEFFNTNGGVAQFGYPISNFELHDERIVQYFQRARFEWRPENPPGQRVTLTDLGSRYFEVREEDPIRLLAQRDNNVLQTILSLRVRAFLASAVTGLEGQQTLHIIVQDQNLLPVSNAQVSLVVRMPSGEEVRYIVPEASDEHGLTSYTFPFKSSERGLVKIWVIAQQGSLEQRTIASFRIWW